MPAIDLQVNRICAAGGLNVQRKKPQVQKCKAKQYDKVLSQTNVYIERYSYAIMHIQIRQYDMYIHIHGQITIVYSISIYIIMYIYMHRSTYRCIWASIQFETPVLNIHRLLFFIWFLLATRLKGTLMESRCGVCRHLAAGVECRDAGTLDEGEGGAFRKAPGHHGDGSCHVSLSSKERMDHGDSWLSISLMVSL